jgi:zinc finger protein-like protein
VISSESDEFAKVDYNSRRSGLVSKLRQKCASVRASLETHVRAEEAEIWPLFAEHFSEEEQSALVGSIIGRTGAVVLQALIPWVMGSFSDAEKIAMIDSLRNAAKNTRFDNWMDAMVPASVPTANSHELSCLLDTEVPENRTASITATTNQEEDRLCHALDDADSQRSSDVPVAQVLQQPSAADSSAYRPGWGDIFRMNASQLEAAAAHSSSTPGDDKHRQNYLVHHLIVSRFLVAQQQRMHHEAAERSCPEACGTASVRDLESEAMTRSSFEAQDVPTQQGCTHYRNKCTIIAPCCNTEVACRICHDESAKSCKALDRYSVVEMVCRVCGKRQPCAQQCAECQTIMARYYCSVCHLFDETPGARTQLSYCCCL